MQNGQSFQIYSKMTLAILWKILFFVYWAWAGKVWDCFELANKLRQKLRKLTLNENTSPTNLYVGNLMLPYI